MRLSFGPVFLLGCRCLRLCLLFYDAHFQRCSGVFCLPLPLASTSRFFVVSCALLPGVRCCHRSSPLRLIVLSECRATQREREKEKQAQRVGPTHIHAHPHALSNTCTHQPSRLEDQQPKIGMRHTFTLGSLHRADLVQPSFRLSSSLAPCLSLSPLSPSLSFLRFLVAPIIYIEPSGSWQRREKK